MGISTMGCGGSEDDKKAEAVQVVAKPGPEDMAAAKVLYVKLKAKWDSGVENCPTSIDDLRMGLGDGGMTTPWSGMEGLRHKYFGFDSESETVCGVYCFYSQAALDKYMASDLFKSHDTMPHFSSVEGEVHNVLVGTENSIENYDWPHSPPSREEVTAGAMLVVRLDIDLAKLAETFGKPAETPEADLEQAFYMNFKTDGQNYCGASFGKATGPKGLRGKYFTWNAEKKVCSGFYTFVTKADLDAYMASDLFKTQADPPFITLQSATPYEMLPGTEITIDQGSWTAK